jgi:hypothetical protein
MQGDGWQCEVMGRDAEGYLPMQTAEQRYDAIYDDARGFVAMSGVAQ